MSQLNWRAANLCLLPGPAGSSPWLFGPAGCPHTLPSKRCSSDANWLAEPLREEALSSAGEVRKWNSQAHYFVAFLTASSSPSHITPQISVDPERKMSSGTLDHLESQVLSPSISGVSVGPVRTWRESKISRQSQLLLLPEPRPLWRGGEP